MSRPGHLIHVGFPNAASTSLQAWFAAHPQLVHAPSRFGGYDRIWDLARSTRGPDAPLRWHVSSEEQLLLPQPADLTRLDEVGDVRERRRRVCATLRMLAPGATILIVTRAARGALMSMYSHYVRHGGRLGIAEMVEAVDVDAILDHDGAIALYEEAFGAEHVIVLPFELLRDDPAAFLAALSDRLGLTAPPPALPHLNRSPSSLHARPDELPEGPRGRATALVARPLHARYRAEYLGG